MFKWLRRKLGMDEVVSMIWLTRGDIAYANDKIKHLEGQLGIIMPSLGRIIAKLDPAFTKSYDDPTVRAESDRIGAEVIERLMAEAQARKHTTGEL